MRREFRFTFWLGICCTAMLLAACQEQISYPKPSTRSLSPSSIVSGQPAFTLTVTGSNFTPASVVEWDGSALVTLFQSTNALTAQIPAIDIQNAGQADVTVVTPSPGGGASNPPLTFTINPAPSPAPQITAISPSGVTTGSAGFTLIITGKNFFTQSTVTVDNIARSSAFIDSTTLQVGINSADIANSGMVPIVVVNPPPNGGSSAVFLLTVSNPVPGIGTLNPTSSQAGATGPSLLTLTGTGYVPNSVVELNGSPHTTAFTNATTLTVTLTPADLAAGGVEQVQVFNPAPGGGTSNIVGFPITPTDTAGLPVIVDVAPNGVQANNGICGACTSGLPTLSTAGPSVSQTGEFVAFASNSTNLLSVTTPTNGLSDIFLRDTCLTVAQCAPKTTLISQSVSGGATDGPSTEPSLDTSGTTLAFTSTASNIVNYVAVSGGGRQVYWTPMCPTTTSCSSNPAGSAVLVSIAADGLSAGNGESFNPSISPDGQFVAFVSLATNLVSGVTTADGVTPQVYVRNTCNGVTSLTVAPTCIPETYLVSSADGATPGNGASGHPVVASAGAFVAFASVARNLGATAPNPTGAQEIFEQVECLGVAGCTLATNLVSTPDGVTPATGASIEPSMSPEGRFVAFASTAGNLGAATGGVQQIFVRDTCTGVTITTPPTCTPSTILVSSSDASLAPATPGNGMSENPSVSPCATIGATTCTDGQLIAFASNATNLGSNVQNGIENIFVRNTCLALPTTTTACTPRVGLASQPAGASPAPANGSSNAPSISADGHAVGFLSAASNLVTGDNNGLVDAFLGATSF